MAQQVAALLPGLAVGGDNVLYGGLGSGFSESSGLLKRDACVDAFGTGWITSTCTPGTTLCCEHVAILIVLPADTWEVRSPAVAQERCFLQMSKKVWRPGSSATVKTG
ncbi:uncharacterized protein MYCFIDRAFT_83552 [Pseudocercospora fijiensis CIRAD86]|uniref:Uncharacterized protein n=1 Tax=Pseudocercospora fijiensis (strain CIRAD86) TaxID=383855 RepID=M3AXK7_PSEFD|nr:uncharacterized protein MYCFIDRAFT_83552 [Pseudocercospora fijiensis CIRAD86]EME82197.1 hypothetical protein MYCFIDRAFT_83552 [Pseudocercospora fijiensis CIRAD86]